MYQKLLTRADEDKLAKSPLYSTEKTNTVPVLVKFFTPWTYWTWYAVEGKKEGDDWLFFGMVDGHEKELGYFRLSELKEIRGPMGLKIERDMHFDDHYLHKDTNVVDRKPE